MIPLSLKSQSGWQTITSPTTTNLTSVFFINSNTGIIVGGDGNATNLVIMKSTNAGYNWYIVHQQVTKGLLNVFFVNSQTGYAVGGYYPVSIILKTTDSGDNWFSQNSGLNKALYSVYFINENTGFICADWGTIIKTLNGGNIWSQVNSCTTDFLESITFTNELTGYSVGRAGQIIKSTDGGNNWFYLVNYSSWLNSIVFINNQIGFTVGTNGKILKTINEGSTWNQINLGVTNELKSIKFLNQNTGYITGSGGLILYTSNAGNNWISQITNTNKFVASSFFSDQYNGVACGYEGLILKTQTGGFSMPSAPTLASPANNSVNISPTPTLTWNVSSGATQYKVQISTVPIFSVISDSATITSTNYSVPSGKLSPGYTYYWRVNASNNYGTSPWSSVWNFSTSVLPPAPTLISPANGTLGTTQTPTLTWSSIPGILNYRVQISTVPDFAIITDSSTLSTNQYTVPAGKLSMNITYYWRVCARNSFGWGAYSIVWYFIPMTSSFNLISSEITDKFMLHPNYPNPFNPDTKINFDIAKTSNVKILIYDISGRIVANILNHQMNPGKYSFTFSGKDLSTGIYFLSLNTEYYSDKIRLVLLK
jgi:photosystem II stability/assembly factor-like uncharacterized protein